MIQNDLRGKCDVETRKDGTVWLETDKMVNVEFETAWRKIINLYFPLTQKLLNHFYIVTKLRGLQFIDYWGMMHEYKDYLMRTPLFEYFWPDNTSVMEMTGLNLTSSGAI